VWIHSGLPGPGAHSRPIGPVWVSIWLKHLRRARSHRECTIEMFPPKMLWRLAPYVAYNRAAERTMNSPHHTVRLLVTR